MYYNTIPAAAAPFLAIPLADQGLVFKSVSDYLQHRVKVGYRQGKPVFGYALDEDTLSEIAGHILQHDFHLVWATNCLEAEMGIPADEWTNSPSWWITDVLPALRAEYQRRHRPKRAYKADSPLARLKALDLASVAGRYTQLHRAGPGKFKGRCPLHEERTPSFYVYEESQRWRCFGACATGGDVVNLLAAIRQRRRVVASV